MAGGRLAGVIACAVAALVFAGDAGALLDWRTVRITPSGPVPRTVRAYARDTAVSWVNDGTNARRVVFADGSCQVRVSPSARQLYGCVLVRPGRHAYRIEGVSAPAASGIVVVVK
jgi:hypothetical protein